MRITISGKNMNAGESLVEHAENALTSGVTKYFERAVDAEVVFSKEKAHYFKVTISVNEGTGTGVKICGEASDGNVYSAFDAALERIEKQLRRYHRRIKNHHRKKQDMILPAQMATKYVLSAEADVPETEEDNPLIIAEKEHSVERLTVSDAVMRMELANLPALMFINKKTGNVNVVYHRADGNISWVDATDTQARVEAAA